MSIFSYLHLIENLKKYDNFGLFYDNQWQEFKNFEKFIYVFIKKISLKKSQGFFNYIKTKKLTKIRKLLIKLNNNICYLNRNKNNLIISGSLLTKKIFKKTEQRISIFQLKQSYDFKIYHLVLNLFFFIKLFKKKTFYFFPIEEEFLKDDNIKKNLKFFFDNLRNKNLSFFLRKFFLILLQNIVKVNLKHIKILIKL